MNVRADRRHHCQPKIFVADDKARLPPTIFGLVSGNFMGVHSADGHGNDFLVRLPSRIQVDARRQLPVHFMVGVRNVPVVFLERKHFERDEFRHRKRVPREKNRLPRGAVANRENNFGVGRAHVFCRGADVDVRGIRLRGVDLQSAGRVLFVRDDMPVAGFELADEFADGLPARRGTIRRHDFAVRILGHADILELEHGAGAIPIRLEVESRVLPRGRLSAKFHLPRMVLGAPAFDGVFLAGDGGAVCVRVAGV